MEKLPDNYPTRNVPTRNLLIGVWVTWQMTRVVNVYNMHIIHTVEESRWGKSSRRTVVVHIMSESSYGGYFLPGVIGGGGGWTPSTASPAATRSLKLYFSTESAPSPHMSILTLRSASAPSSQLSHFFSLLPLWLPPPPSVTPTFSCNFPWQHPPREEGDIVKVSRWYKSGYVSDWQQNVLIPGLWRGVITSPLRVYITRHCYFTGYILPPPWEPDVEKVNEQLVLMQDYFLPAGVCAWEQQLKVGCRCSRVSLLLALVFQSLCYIPWPLTHASESSLPQGQTNYSC